jgi:muramoyltetrapeptide carboxypeptidase
MISPRPLVKGDLIGIVATARKVSEENVTPAIEQFKSWGLETVLSPHLYNQSHSYLAGTDDERRAALQQFLDDPRIRAVICARGGYGTTRIIDQIDFSEFKKNPKWVAGFSDITAIHLKISSLGFESIHGTMPVLFSKSDSGGSIEQLRKALFGEPLEMFAPANELNHSGTGSGYLIGGNLSLITDSLGTPHEPDTDGKILILEEVDEYLYKVDRMIVQLKRAGKLDHLAGLAIGHFTDIKDTDLRFGESVEQIIRYHTQQYPYPVAFGFPTGHENPNLSWIEGRQAILTVGADGASLRHAALPDQI